MDNGADGSAGTALEGAQDKVVVPPESLIWVPTWHCVPVLLWASGDWPLMGWWLSCDESGGSPRVLFGLPLLL